MNRLRLEFRRSRCGPRQSHRARQIKIDQLPALGTERVIVTVCFAIVTAGAVAEFDLMNQALIPQKPQRVINRGEANPGKFPTGRIEDLGGSGMMITRLHRVEHNLTLASQPRHRRFGLQPSHIWNYNNSKLRVKRAAYQKPDREGGRVPDELLQGNDMAHRASLTVGLLTPDLCYEN